MSVAKTNLDNIVQSGGGGGYIYNKIFDLNNTSSNYWYNKLVELINSGEDFEIDLSFSASNGTQLKPIITYISFDGVNTWYIYKAKRDNGKLFLISNGTSSTPNYLAFVNKTIDLNDKWEEIIFNTINFGASVYTSNQSITYKGNYNLQV